MQRSLIAGFGVAAAAVLSALAFPIVCAHRGGAALGPDAALRVAPERVLVDAEGRTLYMWHGEDRRACGARCERRWPPETTRASVRAGRGVDALLIGLARRGDGTVQVTYAGHLLYRYAGDTRAGVHAGLGRHAFGALWCALSVGGEPITRLG